uniref:Integral membrane protein 2 n=1 Tax=Panagrellus redivivus TaxID=6233 RepID=A0A7E4VE90_PANRE
MLSQTSSPPPTKSMDNSNPTTPTPPPTTEVPLPSPPVSTGSISPSSSSSKEKRDLPDGSNPNFSPPPPLRVSPPPSYTSGSFRRCDNKKPDNCVYCGGAKNYWDKRSPSQQALFAKKQRTYRALTTLGFFLVFLVAFVLLVCSNHRLFQKPYNGWCGTTFMDGGKAKQFGQEMEIDPNESYEQIRVPKFGANRPAVFVHDFKKNVTAIVDVLGDRCFLKPLDRNVVVPPKNFIDLIDKMHEGYYAPSPKVIHETFRVGGRLSADDLYNIDSAMVSRHCGDKELFQIVRASRSVDSAYFVRDKRESTTTTELATPAATTADPTGETLQFAVSNGDNVEIEKILLI